MSDQELRDLLSDLNSSSATDRRYAAEDLGDLGMKEAVPALIDTLQDPEIAVREAAAEALIQIGGDLVCREVVKMLDDEDAAVRNLALEIFERLRAGAITACVDLYSSKSHDLRKIAVDTLGKIEETRNSREGFQTLVQAMEDPHINVASSACEALGRIGGKEAVHSLSRALGRHAWMDATIILSLARIDSAEARKALRGIDRNSLDKQGQFALDQVLTTTNLST